MATGEMGISVRDAMVPVKAGQSFMEAVRNLGVSAVELEVKIDLTCPAVQISGRPASVADARSIAELRHTLADGGIRPTALLVATDFSGPQAEAHVGWAASVVRAAAALGAPVIRIDPLTADRALPAEVVRERFVRRTAELLEQTAGAGVDLGIENHGPIANDPAFLDAVFAALPDPRLGLTLDTGNFYWFGFSLEEMYGLIDRYGPRAKHTHLKSINYPPDLANRRRPVGIDYGKYCCSLTEGNIDLARVVRSLRNAGYRRDLCIENESLGKLPAELRAAALRADVEALTTALRAKR